jgi:hypothetical protein
MVQLTSWLDPFMEGVSRNTGIPTAQLSSHVGGEFIGTLLERISATFSKGFMKLLIDIAAGGIAAGYAIYGKDVPERLRRELLQTGSHLLFRVLEAIDFAQIYSSAKEFFGKLSVGDINGALSTVLRTPEEILSSMGISVAPSPAPAMTASSYVITPPPASTPPETTSSESEIPPLPSPA